MEGVIRVLVVEDHPATAAGLRDVVATGDRTLVMATAASLNEANRVLASEAIDVVVCDFKLPDGTALDLLANQPRPPVIVFTAFDDAPIMAAAMAVGAEGFIPKSSSPASIVDGIRAVAAGGTAWRAEHLRAIRGRPAVPTAREIEVIRLVAAGFSNDEVARRLEIQSRTVESHLRRMFVRYGEPARAALVARAIKEHWI